MSNCKQSLLAIAAVLAMGGCLPRSQSFCYEYTVNRRFFEAVAKIYEIEIDSIRVFRAHLLERLVERDAIPEYKLLNVQSREKGAELADSKNYHYLYLFQLFPRGSMETIIVYLGTSFSPRNICIGLGPAYSGFLDATDRQAKIHFDAILKVGTLDRKADTAYVEMKKNARSARTQVDGANVQDRIAAPGEPGAASIACAPSAARRQYLLKYDEDTHLVFLPGQSFTQTNDMITFTRIDQVIKDDVNKIGGKKALIFTTQRVFGDPDALVFTYHSTLK
jgi:hypothetical protein